MPWMEIYDTVKFLVLPNASIQPARSQSKPSKPFALFCSVLVEVEKLILKFAWNYKAIRKLQ